MQDKAREIVLRYYQKQGISLAKEDVFIVWFCKTLQNWKCILATTNTDKLLFEVTCNGNTKEIYVDVYDKKENIVVRSDK